MFQKIAKFEKNRRLAFDLSLILGFAILITIPIFFMGIPGGADMPQHFQFAKTFDDAIHEGDFYPSWSMSPNGETGGIGNRFYPPLTHYVFVIFKNIAGNWFDGFCLSVILFFFLGGAGIYFWSREFFGETASLFGAITYIVLPNHLNQIYGAGMYGEFAAAAIAPFCFLFAYKVCQKGRLTDVCGLAISFALLILTHLPLTIMCSIVLFFYALFSLKGAKIVPVFLRLGASVAGALLLSCFYWSRMVTELAFVNHNSEAFSTGMYAYQYNFLFAKYLRFTGAKLTTGSDYNDLTLLISLGIFISCALIYFIKSRESKNFRLTNAAVLMAVSLFFATPLSINIWQNVSLLQKTQFPWRWLALIEIGTAIFAAAAFDPCIEYFKTSKRFLAIICIGLWFVGISFNVTEVMNPLITYPKDYFNPLIERWKSMPSNDCWWTVWAKPSEDRRTIAHTDHLPEKVVVENRQTSIENWTATERIFTVGEGEANQVFVSTFYYPHWKAEINGQPTEIFPTEGGLISFAIPPEKSRVRIHFQEPWFVFAAYYISGFMWIMILGILLFNLFRSTPAAKTGDI